MSRKVITASMAVAAFAILALAGNASAAQLTSPTGTRVATGTKVKATNIGVSRFKNDEGTTTLTECTSTTLTGEVLKNNGTEIEANITTATASGTGGLANGMTECTGTFGNFTPTLNGGGVDGENVENGTPWCLKSVNGTDEFTIRGNLCTQAQRKITFIVDITSGINCKYERAEAIKGTFTTDTTGDAVLSMAANSSNTFKGEAGNSFICPVSGTLEISYTLEADEAGVTPMYIS